MMWRLFSNRNASQRSWLGKCLAFLPAVWILSALTGLSAAEPMELDVVLRLQWMSDSPYIIDGEVSVAEGTLQPLANLSMHAGTTGAFWTDDEGQRLHIRPRGATDRLGLDVRFRGKRNARINIRQNFRFPNQTPVPGGGTQQAIETSIAIEELLHGVVDRVVAGGIRMWVGRPEGDSLRVQLGTTSALVFNAGEKVPCIITPNAIQNASKRPVELRVALHRDSDNSQLWQKSLPLNQTQTVAIEAGSLASVDAGLVIMPEQEGTYTLTARLVPSAGARLVDRITRPDLLLAQEVLTQRSLQFVVLEPLPPAVDPTPFTEIAKLDLNTQGWIPAAVNLPSGNPLSGSNPLNVPNPLNLGNTLGSTLGKITGSGSTAAVILAPGDQLARRIPILSSGVPHLLVVRYRKQPGTKLGMSIRQADAVGSVAPLGIDTGVVIESSQGILEQNQQSPGTANALTSAGEISIPLGEHRIPFWSHSKDPLFVIANTDSRVAATIESISVLAGPKRLGGGHQGLQTGRTAAIYLDKALIADAFSCERRQVSPGVALDDWTTFLQAGQRLVEYTQASGANAAILTVLGEGGSLYPAEHLFTTPRYDTGCFFADDRDPIRKDVVELLFRMFDRAGLRLIPALEFATPLPELERLIADPSSREGLEWVDGLNRQYVDGIPSQHGLAPYYNTLDPRVVNQIQEIVNHFQQRYGHHRSFHALGLHLGPQTYLQLPATVWGRDSKTLERFRQTDPSLPATAAALNNHLDQAGAGAFTQWRANCLTQIYQQLAGASTERPIMLLTADYLPPVGTNHAAGSLQWGIDWRALAESPHIVPLRVYRERLTLDASRRLADERMNEDRVWDESLRAGAGVLFFRPPQESKTAYKLTATWGPQAGELTTFTQSLPQESEYQRRLARMLLGLDPKIIAIGGWTPAFGQEHAGKDFLQNFTKLPLSAMSSLTAADGQAGTVLVRQGRIGKQTVAYALNWGSWPAQLELFTDAAAGTPVQIHGSTSQRTTIGDKSQAGGTGLDGLSPLWRGTLEPGELQVYEIQGPAQGIVRWTATSLDQQKLIAQLGNRLDELKSRVALLGRPRPFHGLKNASFEEGEIDKMPGWLRAQHPVDCVRWDNDAIDGQRALVLRTEASANSRTWLLSEVLQAPETGRLAVALHARSLRDSGRLRLSIEAKHNDNVIRHWTEIDLPPSTTWSAEPYWLRIDNLPATDLRDLRVAIDLVTPGEVAIDNVKVYDFFLNDRERAELQQQTFVSRELLRKGDLTATAQLLDSYWAKYLFELQVVPTTSSQNADLAAPATRGPDRVTPTSELPTEKSAQGVPAQGVSDRWRRWLPETLRF